MGNDKGMTSSSHGLSTAAASLSREDEIKTDEQKHAYVLGYSDGYDEGQAQAAASDMGATPSAHGASANRSAIVGEPVSWLRWHSYFNASPHGQDAEGREALEVCEPHHRGAFPVYAAPTATRESALSEAPTRAEAVNPTHDVTRLREALETCRKRFAEYVDMHWAKGAHGKADRNREMVDLIDAALSDGVNKGGE